jgi:hypothetical protein
MARALATYPALSAPVAPAGAVEARRRFIVRLVLLIYVLSLIEGPLRKWFLPGLSAPLYFLRDPFLLVLYAYALHHGVMTRLKLARVWYLFIAVTTIAAVIPFVAHGITPMAYVLGARSYWLYVPLGFIVAATFTREDLERFFRWNVLLAIPYAALVVYQYQQPPGAWINRGTNDEHQIAQVSFGIPRPYGLFTYTGQNVGFTAFLVANYVAYVFTRRRGWRELLLTAAGATAVGSCAVLTGSRSIYFLVALILLVTLVGSTLARPTGRVLRRNALILLAVAVAAGLYTSVYGDMFTAMVARFERAAAAEADQGGLVGRAVGGILGWLEPMVTAPFFGHGIGTGTPALSRFLDTTHLRYGESELQRVVNELGPFFGAGFIAMRWLTAAAVLWIAFLAARGKNFALLPFAAYVCTPLVLGQLTHSPLNAFLPWLSVGFIAAMMQNNIKFSRR